MAELSDLFSKMEVASTDAGLLRLPSKVRCRIYSLLIPEQSTDIFYLQSQHTTLEIDVDRNEVNYSRRNFFWQWYCVERDHGGRGTFEDFRRFHDYWAPETNWHKNNATNTIPTKIFATMQKMVEKTGARKFRLTRIHPTGWTRRGYADRMAENEHQRLAPLDDLRKLSHISSFIRAELRRWLAIRSCIHFDCALGPELNGPSQQAITLYPEVRNLAITYNHSDFPESVATNLLSLPKLRCLTIFLNLRIQENWQGRRADDPPFRRHPGQSLDRMNASFVRVARKSRFLVHFQLVPNSPIVRNLFETDAMQEVIDPWIIRRINWQEAERRAIRSRLA